MENHCVITYSQLYYIYLAGFDGYSHDTKENYGSRELEFYTRNAVLDAMNEGMSIVLKEFRKEYKVEFLTVPKYLNIE